MTVDDVAVFKTKMETKQDYWPRHSKACVLKLCILAWIGFRKVALLDMSAVTFLVIRPVPKTPGASIYIV